MVLRPRVLFLIVALLVLGAAGTSLRDQQPVVATSAPPTTTTAAPPTAEAAAASAPADTAPPAPATTAVPDATTTTAPPPPPRVVTDLPVPTTPFATIGSITLLHPSTRVERVGFHQSNHEGAQQMTSLPTTVAAMTMEARDRLSGDRTAADVVIDPAVEVRSPVTGTVKRGGGYTLYCKYRDDYVVISPDASPAWEVKVLHINGIRVRAGDRVIAGETVLAPGPTPLPFASQVDDFTADPAWPHVHIEVVDPSIRNIPSPGGGCS